MPALRSVPEQGQLAVVRQRCYVVTDVRRGALCERPPHLVSLTSIEDDALGEALQVIWQIEPGARAFEKMELPEPKGFDQPAHLEAFLNAVRWGAAYIADTRLLLAALDARGRDRTDSIRKQLADRAEDETAKITAIPREREAAIHGSTSSPSIDRLIDALVESGELVPV